MAGAPPNGSGAAAVGGDGDLVNVQDLKVHFPITSGIVFQRQDRPPCTPSTASASR